MKKTVVLLCSMMCVLAAFSQEEKSTAFEQKKQTKFSRWTIELGGGVSLPLNNVYTNSAADYLQPFDNQAHSYLQLGTTYFFTEHWGAILNVQMLYSRDADQRAVNFINKVYDKYQTNYYMETSSAIGDGSDQDITTGGIGIVYRHQYKKWSFMPRLVVGITGIYGFWGKTLLKQKNTNNLTQVKYEPDQTSYNTFAFIPAIRTSYRLSRKFLLNLDVTYNYSRSETVINETSVELNTGAANVTQHEYKKPLHAITAGAGLSYIFK